MPDPLHDRDELSAALRLIEREAEVTEKDVDLIVEVVRELGARLLGATAPGR